MGNLDNPFSFDCDPATFAEGVTGRHVLQLSIQNGARQATYKAVYGIATGAIELPRLDPHQPEAAALWVEPISQVRITIAPVVSLHPVSSLGVDRADFIPIVHPVIRSSQVPQHIERLLSPSAPADSGKNILATFGQGAITRAVKTLGYHAEKGNASAQHTLDAAISSLE
jgi:hypothetical protein